METLPSAAPIPEEGKLVMIAVSGKCQKACILVPWIPRGNWGQGGSGPWLGSLVLKE